MAAVLMRRGYKPAWINEQCRACPLVRQHQLQQCHTCAGKAQQTADLLLCSAANVCEANPARDEGFHSNEKLRSGRRWDEAKTIVRKIAMLTSVRGLVAATFLFGCGLAATPALADETDPPSEFTVTGNVAGVTDYRFRGLSLSGGDFAIQGGVRASSRTRLTSTARPKSISLPAGPVK
jgi:hypothetical protein